LGQDLGFKAMGGCLRDQFGKDLYVVGFAFRKGELRARYQTEAAMAAPSVHTVPGPPEGSGSAVLGAAGLPLFFLDATGLPADGALSLWLNQSHLFWDVGAIWNTADPLANLIPEVLAHAYDGIIFVDEGHAARPLP